MEKFSYHKKEKSFLAEYVSISGMLQSTFSYAFQNELNDLYTVVHWDQRGAGKTLTKNKNRYLTIEAGQI